MPMQIHVDQLITENGDSLSTDSIKNDNVALNALQDISLSNVQDGDQLVWNSSMGKWINSGYQANTLQSIYNLDAGIHLVSWGSDIDSTVRPMNVDFYGGKAWAELMYCADPSPTAPWDYWIDNSTNGMKSYNLTGSGGLDYFNGSCAVLISPQIMSNLLLTAKTAIAGGINQEVAIDCSHMSSINRYQFLDYFTGVIPGFEQLDTFGLAGGVGNFDTHLGYRNGSIQDDEWMVADSVAGGSIGAPLWGWRRTGQHKGGFARGVPVSENVIFSIWGTNY